MKFDLSGERFFMVTDAKVGVHQAEDAKLVCEMENQNQKRILCAAPGEVSLVSYVVFYLFMFEFPSFQLLVLCFSIARSFFS